MLKLPREGRYWLLAAVALFAAGWMKGINLILLMAHLMLSLLVLNWLLAFWQLRRLSARRQSPAMIFAGEETAWEVILKNERPGAGQGIVVHDTGPDHRQQWFLSRIEPESETRITGRTVFPTRGRYSLEPVRAECLYPFGLAGRGRILGPAEEWIILPQLGRLNGPRFRRWLATAARGDGRIHRLARPSMIRQDDLHGLRPFRPGDSPRWIHWRTSARRNQRMVREFEEAAGQDLIVIFDPWSEKPGPAGTDKDLEDAISLAASVCDEWCSQRQDQVVLAVAGPKAQIVSGYTCRATLVQLLRALAVVQGQNDGSVTPVLQALSSRSIHDAPVLVIGSRKPAPLASALSAGWHRLVVSLNPQTAIDFYDPPGSARSPKRPERALEPIRG